MSKNKILQFGEGNFLRGFVDYFLDKLNKNNIWENEVILVQPIPNGMCDILEKQDYKYHLVLRGIKDNEPYEEYNEIDVIKDSVNPYVDFKKYINFAGDRDIKFIVSNTTESGIVYEKEDYCDDKVLNSFPAKLTQFLYARFKKFNGESGSGFIFLPCELIDDNGYVLKEIILKHARDWNFEEEFINWIERENIFTSTLVDRIVTGYSQEIREEIEKKYNTTDACVDTAEIFNLWVIETNRDLKNIIPLHKVGNIVWTDNAKPYKKRKVRILNGGHTSTVLAAIVSGKKIVREFMNDDLFRKFLSELLKEEVIETIDMDRDELFDFEKSVEDRFLNPYIDHRLLDISLNSISKYKVRCLVSLLDYYKKFNKLPKKLVFSLAALIRFYKINKVGENFVGIDDFGNEYTVKDDEILLNKFEKYWSESEISNVVKKVLADSDFWDMDLNEISGLKEEVLYYLNSIVTNGIVKTMECL